MFEPIEDMPAGTVGFRAHREITAADYADTLVPALEEAVAAGEVRLLVVTAPDFDESDIRGQLERAKANLRVGGHKSDWRHIAVVTDNSWLRRSQRLWTRLVPVHIKVFKTAEEDKARDWITG
jgi:hypothetical protein